MLRGPATHRSCPWRRPAPRQPSAAGPGAAWMRFPSVPPGA